MSEERESKRDDELETSSSAPVFLEMKGSSNKVTVWVRGQDAKRKSKSVTFINRYADPQITAASNNQRGATGGRLPEPLEVIVKDGSSSSGKAIPGGVVVGFTAHAGNDDGDDDIGMFIPVAGTTVYIDGSDALVTTDPATPDALTAMATATSPISSEGPVFVRTDSSGKAQIYFQLGSKKGQQRVNIKVNGQDYDNTFFRATAADVVSTDASTISIIDGDGQRADVDEPLDDPLVVMVRDAGGRIVADAEVTFTTNSGALAPPEPGDPGNYTAPDPNTHTSRFIVVNADDTGQASVRYNVGDLPGAKEVFARIDVANGRTRTKTFSVNGRATPQTQRDDEDDEDEEEEEDEEEDEAVTPSVPSSVSGSAGGTATLRVTAAATADVRAGGIGDTFPLGNVGSFSRSGTRHTSTLTLPNQVATYSLTVFVGRLGIR